MKKVEKILAVLLSAILLVSFAGIAVSADNDLPSADVEIVTNMRVDANMYKQGGGTGFDAYIQDNPNSTTPLVLNKAAIFRAAYGTKDSNGDYIYDYYDADVQADLAVYKNWRCDFKFNINMDLPGDSLILYGDYGSFNDIAFKASFFGNTFAKGDYYLIQGTGLDSNLTYNDIVESVKKFTCGIADVSLPIGAKITVTLVMFDDEDQEHQIGEPIIYEKNAPAVVERESMAEESAQHAVVTGLAEAAVAPAAVTAKVEEVSSEGVTNIDIIYYAKVEETEYTDRYDLSAYAVVVADGEALTEKIPVETFDDNRTIYVTVPLSDNYNSKPNCILHKTNDGKLIEVFAGDNLEYDSKNKTYTVGVSHFSYLEPGSNIPFIDDVDAYKYYDGTGNIRFMTTVYTDKVITAYGTWIVTDGYLEHGFDPGATVVKLEKTASIAHEQKFKADLLNIPAAHVNDKFYAKSFIRFNDNTQAQSDVKEATIEQYKNNTSR